MDKILAIIGGMGPKASLLLHTLLLSELPKYKNVANDQDFLNILHFSYSGSIVDRMSYLLGYEGMNPADEIFEEIKSLEIHAHQRSARIIAGIPCNTFHAQLIYDHLLGLMKTTNIRHVELIHLIEETAIEVEKIMPKKSKIGILSTTGEWKMHIYDSALTQKGFEVIRSDENLQIQIQACIYNKEWGLKTASTNYSKSVEHVLKILDQYKIWGAEAIIWGCTEFSLISEEISRVESELKFFDSTKILAERMITKAIEKF